MHPRTEDLLTLRDGDPADADKVARWRAVPGTAHAVARLERMRDALRALPELDPPAGSWETIEARLAAPEPSAGRASGRETARGAFAARVAGSAAALVLTAMAVMTVTTAVPPRGARDLHPTTRDDAGAAGVLGDSLRAAAPRHERAVGLPPAGGGADSGAADDGVAESFARLQQESATLETVLGAISFQRAAMSGATASAIASLEDRIASIDAFVASSPLPAEAEATLMRVRVDLLAALVNVRLAQAQPIPF